MSSYTQLKLKPEYRTKLKALADRENRSMANYIEWLIDREASDPTELPQGQGSSGEGR